jgi:hypothetical protein
MKAYHSTLRSAARCLGLALILCGLLIAPRALAGNWLPLANQPPNNEGIGMMLLLSDGTVMCSASDASKSLWFRLTPDQNGSYVNGTWTQLANATYGRLYYTSDVLTNGTVFVAGGEYGTGKTHIQIYDPVANTWSEIFPPLSLYNTNLGDYFADTISAVIPDGSVLMAPALNNAGLGNTALHYNPGSSVWSDTGVLAQHVPSQGECTWTKLADGSILTIDPTLTGNPPHTSERYIPAMNKWIPDSNLPVSVWNIVPAGGSCEIGPGILLPNGHAFFAGGNGNYALYTPSGNTNSGGNANAVLTNGDPVMNTTAAIYGPLPGPFAGQSTNCRACHLVEEQENTGNRTYCDFAPRTPVPANGDGATQTHRNTIDLVNSLLPHPTPLFLHYDGQFATPQDWIISTLTGRNFGWKPTEYATARFSLPNELPNAEINPTLGLAENTNNT